MDGNEAGYEGRTDSSRVVTGIEIVNSFEYQLDSVEDKGHSFQNESSAWH
jgi:hypothetical protein